MRPHLGQAAPAVPGLSLRAGATNMHSEVRPRGLGPAHCSVPTPPFRDASNKDPERGGGEGEPHSQQSMRMRHAPDGATLPGCGCEGGSTALGPGPAAEAAGPHPAVCGPRGVGAP